MRFLIAIAISIVVATQLHAQSYKPNWKKVVGGNGAAYQIDLNSLNPAGNSVSATIYVEEGQRVVTPTNLRAVIFQCPDRMVEISTMGHLMPSTHLPPRSIGRQLADLACAKVHR